MKRIVVAIGAMTLLPLYADARGIRFCSPTPPDATQVARDFGPCLATNEYCGSLSGVQVFGNSERRLPNARNGQTYYEARVGEDRAGFGGQRRLVFLIQGTKGSATVSAKYFSSDHYLTFCQMP